jgi:hypothetical protein
LDGAMKRYFLFYGDNYELGGGFNDFIDSFDSLDEAKEFFLNHEKENGYDHFWCQIVDSHQDFKVISEYYNNNWWI